MNQSQADNAKPIIALMEAVKGVIKRDVALGLYEEPTLRLAIEDRKLVVAELKAQGCSNREIAKVLGVDETTVRRDHDAANAADDHKKPKKTNGSKVPDAANAADEASSHQEAVEADYQTDLYDQVCLCLNSMTDATRRKVFAFIKRTYDA